jgi:type IV secretory pathway TraG/TraD family ATPase VirD4
MKRSDDDEQEQESKKVSLLERRFCRLLDRDDNDQVSTLERSEAVANPSSYTSRWDNSLVKRFFFGCSFRTLRPEKGRL